MFLHGLKEDYKMKPSEYHTFTSEENLGIQQLPKWIRLHHPH